MSAMLHSPFVITVARLWRAGRDTHAIAEALQVPESRVVKAIHAERADRLTPRDFQRIAQARRVWP